MHSQGRETLLPASEIAQILFSAVVLGVAFTMLAGGFGGSGFMRFLWAILTVGVGFIGHELAHKFTAMKFGYWAAYRMWPVGILVALVSALAGFLFAALGAVQIVGIGISQEEEGIISLSGPTFNLVAAVFFMLLEAVVPKGATFFADGAYLNSLIAIWNCLPFLILDGQKIFRWDKRVWALAFGVSVSLFAINY